MAKLPDAFLSYTRFDDRHGAISAFREWLSDALREVTGEPFDIFQDIEGIGIGEYWPGKLDEMLDKVRFFIPILTPSYFRSPACRSELEKFLEAEKKRGRKDLVLPIYYIECHILEDPEARTADHLAVVLHQRQRQDWRELRHDPFEAREVRKALERLARGIALARWRAARQAEDEARKQAEEEAAAKRQAEEEAHRGIDGNALLVVPGTVFRDIDAPWCPEMVVIPPGEFMMGSTEAEREWAVAQGTQREWAQWEKPQHRVRIDYPLAVGRYPVTFAQYDHFCEQTRRERRDDRGWNRGRQPVIDVSWDCAEAYVEWLATETRQPYRLLSEAEWEYACRAGTTTRFWWGDEITPAQANFGGKLGKTSEVGSFHPSPFGLHDMHGNVWEWVDDRWHDTYQGAPEDGSAWLQGSHSRRVVRGGSWATSASSLRSAYRLGEESDFRNNESGFRVARTLSPRESSPLYTWEQGRSPS